MPDATQTFLDAVKELFQYGALGVMLAIGVIWAWKMGNAVGAQLREWGNKILDQWIKTQEADRHARSQIAAASERSLSLHSEHFLADERLHARGREHTENVVREASLEIRGALVRAEANIIDTLLDVRAHIDQTHARETDDIPEGT